MCFLHTLPRSVLIVRPIERKKVMPYTQKIVAVANRIRTGVSGTVSKHVAPIVVGAGSLMAVASAHADSTVYDPSVDLAAAVTKSQTMFSSVLTFSVAVIAAVTLLYYFKKGRK